MRAAPWSGAARGDGAGRRDRGSCGSGSPSRCGRCGAAPVPVDNRGVWTTGSTHPGEHPPARDEREGLRQLNRGPGPLPRAGRNPVGTWPGTRSEPDRVRSHAAVPVASGPAVAGPRPSPAPTLHLRSDRLVLGGSSMGHRRILGGCSCREAGHAVQRSQAAGVARNSGLPVHFTRDPVHRVDFARPATGGVAASSRGRPMLPGASAARSAEPVVAHGHPGFGGLARAGRQA